ncbi:hypothetical protein ABD05_30440 [Burkholderia pyrrocinia]|nr:hypothetical protein ABD05_30440 [Burkholderia pyrrocinia]
MSSSDVWGKMLQRCFSQCIRKLGVVNRTRQQYRSDHRGYGNERSFMRAGLPPVRRLASNKIDHFLDASSGYTPNLGRLTRHFRAEGNDRAPKLGVFDVLFGKISTDKRRQCLFWGGASRDASRRGEGFRTRAVRRLSQHRLARSEVRIEPAVCQAHFFHDVGDTRTAVAAASDRARGGFDDALVGQFFASGCGSWHGNSCVLI